MIAGSTDVVTPEMNIDPVSVRVPIDAPFEPWTWIRPPMPGFWALLSVTTPRPPDRNRMTATAVSSTGIEGWLRLSQ